MPCDEIHVFLSFYHFFFVLPPPYRISFFGLYHAVWRRQNRQNTAPQKNTVLGTEENRDFWDFRALSCRVKHKKPRKASFLPRIWGHFCVFLQKKGWFLTVIRTFSQKVVKKSFFQEYCFKIPSLESTKWHFSLFLWKRFVLAPFGIKHAIT